MNNKLLKVAVVVFACLVALSSAKNTIVKISVEKGVNIVTGLQLGIKSMNVGIIKTLVEIKDLKLYNPKGYKDKVMLDMPEIYVHYDLPAILKGDVRLQEMRIDLREFVVVKNEKGELNLDALNVVKEQKGGKKEAPAGKEEAPSIRIDRLNLKIGKVVYKDYSGGGEPKVQEFVLNLDEEYSNIDDPAKLVSLIVVKALMNTTIARLTNFDLNALQGVVGDTLKTAQQVLGSAGAAGEKLVGMTAEAQKSFSSAAGVAQEAAKDLTKAIKFPFGGEENK
jgi:hypothetical protein